MSESRVLGEKMFIVTRWASIAQIVAAFTSLGMLYYASQTVQQAQDESSEARAYNLRMLESLTSPVLALENFHITVPLERNSSEERWLPVEQKTGGDPVTRVPVIQNYGAGTAINVDLRYLVTKVDGKEVDAEYTQIALPAVNIAPRDRIPLFTLPEEICATSGTGDLQFEGVLVCGCNYENGRRQEAFQSFDGHLKQTSDTSAVLTYKFNKWKINLADGSKN